MGAIEPLIQAGGTQVDPVTGAGYGAVATPAGNPEYVCDDGSTPSSGLCADGSAATFYYIDPNGNWCPQLDSGYCPAGTEVTAALATTAGISSSTLLLIAGAIGAWVYFGGKL